MKETGQ